MKRHMPGNECNKLSFNPAMNNNDTFFNSILGYKVSIHKCVITESRKTSTSFRFFNFRDSVMMALNNRIVHNVFRTIAYTK
jgi:hypothetical protein